jgi:lysozyme family protein
MDKFDTFIERVLSHEGGYVNHPSDPGGETKWGIAKRSYPHLNIKDLTREQAIEIYRRDFWQAVGGHLLTDEVAFQALDAAINHGPANAIRWLQRAVGVADDGVFGPISRAAVGRMPSVDVVLRFNAERLDFYTKLSTWGTFGKGWVRRVANNLRYAAEDID